MMASYISRNKDPSNAKRPCQGALYEIPSDHRLPCPRLRGEGGVRGYLSGTPPGVESFDWT